MKKLGRISGGLLVFVWSVWLLAAVLASLVITSTMPSAATQATWLVGTLCIEIDILLGLINAVRWSANREKLLNRVALPLGMAGLSLLVLTGAFYHFGI